MIIFDRGQFLYMGVHFSLEQAYAEALKKMVNVPLYKKGDAADLLLWNSMEARDVISDLTSPTKDGVKAANGILNSLCRSSVTDAEDDMAHEQKNESVDMTKIPDVLKDILDQPMTPRLVPHIKKAPTGVLKKYYDWKEKNPFIEVTKSPSHKKKRSLDK